MIRALRLTLGSLRKRGPAATLGILATSAVDLWYDWRRGTRTAGWVALEEFSIDSPNREHGRAYQATPAFAFTKLMQKVPLPRDAGFVDFGCGKGRVLLLAGDAGFQRVTGIEFATELVAEANDNIARWRARNSTCDMRVVEGDVLHYSIDAHDRVFFFFNPFDDVILDGVLDRIEESLRQIPREAWIIYHNPLEGARIDARPHFQRFASHTFWGNEFAVYRSAS
ncbi:MAG: class I SAM-dependent methyltransferase [Gemmatimonadota bacterium]